MTMTPVNQLDGTADQHEACAIAVMRSILLDDGKNVPVLQIEAEDAAMGDSAADGTATGTVVKELAKHGVPSVLRTGDEKAIVSAGLAAGHNRFVLLIWSNSNGDPYTGAGRVGHYVETDGVNVMNPIGGRTLGPAYLAACFGASQGSVIEVTRRIGPAPAVLRSNDVAADLVLLASKPGAGYTVDFWGGFHPFGGAPAISGYPYWPNWNNDDPKGIVAAVTSAPDDSGAYLLDRWGGIHAVPLLGAAPPGLDASKFAYWPGVDIAQVIRVTDWKLGHGYTLDGWGGIHPWPGTPAQGAGAPYWPGGAY